MSEDPLIQDSLKGCVGILLLGLQIVPLTHMEGAPPSASLAREAPGLCCFALSLRQV